MRVKPAHGVIYTTTYYTGVHDAALSRVVDKSYRQRHVVTDAIQTTGNTPKRWPAYDRSVCIVSSSLTVAWSVEPRLARGHDCARAGRNSDTLSDDGSCLQGQCANTNGSDGPEKSLYFAATVCDPVEDAASPTATRHGMHSSSPELLTLSQPPDDLDLNSTSSSSVTLFIFVQTQLK